MELTSKQRRYLRSLAHHLKPVVIVGQGGLSTALMGKVDTELDNHELIKVKVSREAPVDASGAAEDLCEETGATTAQIIGRMVVLYRRRKKKPTIQLPAVAEPTHA